MPTSAIIILIIVVWIFVLAPWLLRFQRPVSHTGEAFEDTRVVFSGESGHVSAKRRPRVRATDVRNHFTDEQESEYEIVAAEDSSIEVIEADISADGHSGETHKEALGESEDSPRAFSFRGAVMRARAKMKKDDGGEEDILIEEDGAQPQTIDGEVVDDSADETDENGAAAQSEVSEATDDAAEDKKAETETVVLHAPVGAEDEQGTYSLDDSFISPVDLMYPGAVDSIAPENSAEADEEEAAGDSAGDSAAADAAANSGLISASLVSEDVELSPEEVAFAQRRSGRGGWDPVRDNAVRATRFQRRQRALLLLLGSLLAAVVAGIVLGGKMWLLAAGLGVIVVWYLVALRNLSLAEQALHQRRVAQLRRARLGVRSVNDEELAIPRKLRRPGAIVLEADDESPDFEFLPVYDAQSYDEDEDHSHIINRREVRDELSARRVG